MIFFSFILKCLKDQYAVHLQSFITYIFYPLSPFFPFYAISFPLWYFFFLSQSRLSIFPPFPPFPSLCIATISLSLSFCLPVISPFHPLSSASSPPSILFPPSCIFPILRPGYIPGWWGSRLMCHAGDYGTASSIAALPASLRSRGAMGSGDGGERIYGNWASFWASSCQVRGDILGSRLTGDAADSVCRINGCLKVSIRQNSFSSFVVVVNLPCLLLLIHYGPMPNIRESYLHWANIT